MAKPDRTSGGANVQSDDLDSLRACGIMTGQDLDVAVRAGQGHRVELVEGLLRPLAIMLLCGNSTIGKTPLVLQLLLCLASGTAFLGRQVQRCRTLYLIGEGDQQQFNTMLHAVCRHLGLDTVPGEFLCWSPYWDQRHQALAPGSAAILQAQRVGADVTVADPLRVFWPEAEGKASDAAKVYGKLRKVQTAWVLPHHLRKPDRKIALPDLASDPGGWLVEASGSRALVTGSDVRLGLEARTDQQRGDLLLSGLMRGQGPIGPLYLSRAHDEAGDPIGYTLLQGLSLLSPRDRAALQTLPSDRPFRFTDVKRAFGGTSDSNAARFIERCMSLELLYRSGSHYARDLDKERDLD